MLTRFGAGFFMEWQPIAGGLVALIAGAELLIRGATAIARRFGVSELLIGLTLVGFGTSTPELVSSVEAALIGSPGIAVGNVVGSNIANILLILGLSALVAPFNVDRRGLKRDGFAVLVATVAAIIVSMTGEFSRDAGVVFLAAITLYILVAFFTERRAPDAATAKEQAVEQAQPSSSVLVNAGLAAAGLALLIIGAKYFVSGAIGIAAAFGVSEAVIGLTVVAIGTSLPELVTSVLAAVRGRSALALGNVVGSNIYNLFGILGVTALVRPVAAPAEIVAFDNWVMLGATLLMLMFAISRSRLNRLEGATMVACYALYVGWLALAA